MSDISVEFKTQTILVEFPRVAGGVGGSVEWANIENKPVTFAPSAHGHAIGDVSGLQTALDAKALSVHSHAIGDLTGVSITSPANDQVLTFESSTGLWKNKTAAGGGAITNGQSIVNALIFG